MSTNQISGTITTGVTITDDGTYTDPVTIASNATISGEPAITALAAYSIDNFGTVTGTDNGVYLNAGGSVTNESSGSISGGANGVDFANGGTVDNLGSIAGNAGVLLAGDGTVTNAAGAWISGATYGVDLGAGGSGTVENSGTIIGTNVVGVRLDGVDTLTNASTGTIGSNLFGVFTDGYSATVENAGTITGGTDSVYLDAGGTNRLIVDAGAVFNGVVVANAAAVNTLELSAAGGPGTISGVGTGGSYQYQNFQTVKIDSGATWTLGAFNTSIAIDNAGTVTNPSGPGIVLGAGGSITNESSGLISGTAYGVRLAAGSTGTITNFGTITGTALYGVRLDGADTLTNAANAKISGADYGVQTGVGNSATIENSGTIVGTAIVGVRLHGADALTNTSTGTISGGEYGVYADGSSATVENAGAIAGNLDGIYVKAGTGTIVNSGTITGTVGMGIQLNHGGSVSNEAGGLIAAYGKTLAIRLEGAGTVENAGTITGGVGFYSTGMNRLIVDAGAVFNDGVRANYGTSNTIELSSKNGPGTISGLGSQYQGFQTVTIDSGASWTIAGTTGGFSGTTIQGFTNDDKLDFTGQDFTGGSVDLNTTTDVLTIENAGGTAVGTIQLSGSFTGDFFHLGDDGHGGTYLTEDGTPCYCRGTRILTDKGEVAVEELKIGDRLITASGKAMPIRWIGMRSYSGRFAAGNKDVLPILIRRGALADNVPKRDLWISPLHAMFLEGVLIPVWALVDGVSIVQATRIEQVEYFHLELESHDVIVAEGALSESFLDDHNRGMFHNAATYREIYPDAARRRPRYCAPRIDDGEIVQTVRERIAARLAEPNTPAPRQAGKRRSARAKSPGAGERIHAVADNLNPSRRWWKPKFVAKPSSNRK